MEGLAAGYKVVDSEGKVRIMAKPKTATNEDMEKQPGERTVGT